MPALANLSARLRNRRGVLVDSNVLLDIATNDPKWSDWSGRALAECADLTTLIVNPIIFAEVSIGFATIEALNEALPSALYAREPLPWECFLSYRRRGGARTTPLPDFYFGAHAAIEKLALLTRDTARYQTYFPSVELLGPR